MSACPKALYNGKIPDSISSLTRLLDLGVVSSMISGSIPAGLASLTGIVLSAEVGNINLGNNRLSGYVSSFLPK